MNEKTSKKKLQILARLVNEGSPEKQKKNTQIQRLMKTLVQVKKQKQEVENIRNRLEMKFKYMSVPMNKVEYTPENFKRDFPNNEIETPLGKFSLKNNQYEKLSKKDRELYLGGMKQTYNDPIAIIHKLDKNKKPSKLFGKSFNELLQGNKILTSAVNYKNKGVTIHDRYQNEFLGHIKDPSDLLYEKQNKGGSGTAEDDPYSLNLVGKANNTQSIKNINPNSKNVNKEKGGSKKLITTDLKRVFNEGTKNHIKVLML